MEALQKKGEKNTKKFQQKHLSFYVLETPPCTLYVGVARAREIYGVTFLLFTHGLVVLYCSSSTVVVAATTTEESTVPSSSPKGWKLRKYLSFSILFRCDRFKSYVPFLSSDEEVEVSNTYDHHHHCCCCRCCCTSAIAMQQ